MNLDRKFAAVLTLRAATICLALPFALSAHAESGTLEEIVVTAQKRVQNLQDVGVSVTALGAQQIHDLGITSSMDIGRVAPGVVFTETSSGGAFSTLSIRGIAQSDYSPIQEAPNSIYIDDVYVSSNGAAAFSTYDLDRIEVLRGPQGTLFGRNSTGGLADFITAKPTKTFEGYAETGYGSFNQFWVEAAVSGPLSDRVRARLSVKDEQADGWWKNYAPGGKDTMETNARGIRGQIEVDLTENLLARLSISYDGQPKHDVGTYKEKNFYIGANGLPTPQPANLDAWGTGPGNNQIGYRDSYPNNWSSAFDNIGFLKTDRTSPTLLLQWTLGPTTLTSVTNYTDFKTVYREEDDGSPINYSEANQNQAMTQWSQELRGNGSIGSHTWTAGLYYLDIDTFVYADYFFPILSGTDFAFNDYENMKQRTQSLAPFGQIEWSLIDTLRLTTGLRYTHDTKTFDAQVYYRELGNGYSGGTGSTVFPPPGDLVYDFSRATVGSLAKEEQGLWSGNVRLDYKPVPDTLLYAGIARGVKGAGFNANLSGNLTLQDTPFKAESVLTYELGGKFDLLDHRLRLNSSVYYYDYKNYQGFAYVGVQGEVGNYQGQFYGGDLEITAKIPGDVRVSVSGSYSHTLLKDVPTVYRGVIDQQAPLAPEWVINGSIQKSRQVGPGSLDLIWSFDYLSHRYGSVDNNPATYIEGSIEHNLRLAYDLEKSGLEFAVFVNNVADKQRQLFVYDLVKSGGYTLNAYDKPRWFGVSVRKKF